MASLPPAYFDALYASNPDPWGFRTSDYEAAKYAATVAALPREHYAAGLEVGCSIGELTALLAARCDLLIATDVAAAALRDARARNAGAPNVRFEQHRFPGEVPAMRFDLIVLSEVLYYLDAADLAVAARVVAGAALPRADILLVHWLGETPDYPLTGDAAADGFIAAIAGDADRVFNQATPQYRIDRLRRRR